MYLTEKIDKLSEHQLRAVLTNISLYYRDIVSIAVHGVEKEEYKKGILYK